MNERTKVRREVPKWLTARPDEVRVLAAFVQNMQAELAENSGKGARADWMRGRPRDLLAEIQHHYVKLHAVVVEHDRLDDGLVPRPVPWPGVLRDLIAEFAADVANMAMMLADRCGALHPDGAWWCRERIARKVLTAAGLLVSGARNGGGERWEVGRGRPRCSSG
jgi:hypothetical protein